MRPMSVMIRGAPLLTAVKELGDKVGVELRCVSRPLESRPVVVLTPGLVTASELMQQLAAIASTAPGRCTWHATSIDGGRAYVLREDSASRHARSVRTKADLERRASQLDRDLVAALRLADTPTEQLEPLRADQPDLGTPSNAFRWGLRLLRSLSAEQVQALLGGVGIRLPYSDLREDQQEMLRHIVGDLRTSYTTRRRDGTPLTLTWSSREDLPKSSVTYRFAGDPSRPGIMMLIPTIVGSEIGQPNLLRPPRVPPDEQAEAMRRAVEARDRPVRQAREERRERLRALAAKDPSLARPVSAQAVRDVPDPRKPGRRVQRHSDLVAVLEQLALAGQVSILGDYDPCWDDYYAWRDFFEPGLRMKRTLRQDIRDVPLWEALEQVAEHFRVSWEKRGNLIRIRSPRVSFALADGIDLFDERPPPRPHIPGLDDQGP